MGIAEGELVGAGGGLDSGTEERSKWGAKIGVLQEGNGKVYFGRDEGEARGV